MFLKNFFILLSILILTKIGICAWRIYKGRDKLSLKYYLGIYKGRDKLSLKYYLGIIEWEKEFLKIAAVALLALILTLFTS
ncbi:MAG: hypothetical protein LiPW16_492 [Microgenomates group bacterium LiPW_16]|nr:MAG: hypothetical protein LiPW16_492 [Microgenomates group bacterium LiPW_16]